MLTLTEWLDNKKNNPVYKFTRESLLQIANEQEDAQLEVMKEFMLRRCKATHAPEVLESMFTN